MQKQLKYFISNMIPRFILEESEYDSAVSNNKLSLPLFIEYFFEFLGNSYWSDPKDPDNIIRYKDQQTGLVWKKDINTGHLEKVGLVGDNADGSVIADPATGALYTLNPYNLISSIISLSDIDSTITDYIIYFKKKYALTYPHLGSFKEYGGDNSSEIRRLIKNIHDFYVSKGTENSFKFFFRSFHNRESSLYYPKVDILRPSEGTWYEPYYLSLEKEVVNPTNNNAEWVGFNQLSSWQSAGDDPLFPSGEMQRYIDFQIIGQTSNAYAWIKGIEEEYLPDSAVSNNALQYWVNVIQRYGGFIEGEIVSLFTNQTNPFIQDTLDVDFSIAKSDYRIRNRGYLNSDGTKNPDLVSTYPDPIEHPYKYKSAYLSGALYQEGDIVYNPTKFTVGTKLDSGFYVCNKNHYSLNYPDFKIGGKYRRSSVVKFSGHYYKVKSGNVDYISEISPDYDTGNFVASGYAPISDITGMVEWSAGISVGNFETVYKRGLRTDAEPQHTSRYDLLIPDSAAKNDYGVDISVLDNPAYAISLFSDVLRKNKWSAIDYFYDYLPTKDSDRQSIIFTDSDLTLLISGLLAEKTTGLPSLSDYSAEELGLLTFLLNSCVFVETQVGSKTHFYLAWRKADLTGAASASAEDVEYRLFTRSAVINYVDGASQIGPDFVHVMSDPAYDFRSYFGLDQLITSFPNYYWESADSAIDVETSNSHRLDFDASKIYFSADIVHYDGKLYITKNILGSYNNVVYPANDPNWVYIRTSNKTTDALIGLWDPQLAYGNGNTVRARDVYMSTDDGSGDIYILKTYSDEVFDSLEYPNVDTDNWMQYSGDYTFQDDYNLGSVSDPSWLLLPDSVEPEKIGVADNIFEKGWLDNKSFISWDKRIQDSDYWQDFSYEVTTSLDRIAYDKSLLEVLHPQGLKFFNKVASVNERILLQADLHLGGWRLKHVSPKTYFPIWPSDAYVYTDQYISYGSSGAGKGASYRAKTPLNSDDAALRDLPDLGADGNRNKPWKRWWDKVNDGWRIVINTRLTTASDNQYSTSSSRYDSAIGAADDGLHGLYAAKESKDQARLNIKNRLRFFTVGHDWTYAQNTPTAFSSDGLMGVTGDDFRRNVSANSNLVFINGLRPLPFPESDLVNYKIPTPATHYQVENNIIRLSDNMVSTDCLISIMLRKNSVAGDGLRINRNADIQQSYVLPGDIADFINDSNIHSLMIFKNSMKLEMNTDYYINDKAITFSTALVINDRIEYFVLLDSKYMTVTNSSGAVGINSLGGYLIGSELIIFRSGKLLNLNSDYSINSEGALIFTSDTSDKAEIYSSPNVINRSSFSIQETTDTVVLPTHAEHNLINHIYSSRTL